MLVDVRTFAAGWTALWVAVVMTVIATLSKFMAAWITEKNFKLTRDEGRLIFGLSNAQAAATLAAVLIGYEVILGTAEHFQVFVAGTPIELNRKEYDILLYFIQRPERVINKMTLAESVWGDHIDQVDNFDFIYAQVKNLRKKLTEAGANAEVKAVYGFGYKMSLQAL